MAQPAAGHHRERPVAVRSTLTARQLEVVQLLVSGFRVKQIARILEIGRGTVNEHLFCAREKIGVTTREELIAWAVWNGVATVGKAPEPGIRREPRAVEFAAYGSAPEPPTVVSHDVRAPGESSGKSRGGRPTVMTPDRISMAQMLLAALSVAEVAERIGVSRSTLYKYVRQRDDIPNESRGRDPRRPLTMPRP
jgi:DNA-binding CsgD family transcriptional regulator